MAEVFLFDSEEVFEVMLLLEFLTVLMGALTPGFSEVFGGAEFSGAALSADGAKLAAKLLLLLASPSFGVITDAVMDPVG